MKTITQEMRERAAQIQKIIEDAGVLVEREDYAVRLAVFEDEEDSEIEIVATRFEKDKFRRVCYVVSEKWVSRVTLSRAHAITTNKYDPTPEAISEDLRWLLGEDGKQVKREDV